MKMLRIFRGRYAPDPTPNVQRKSTKGNRLRIVLINQSQPVKLLFQNFFGYFFYQKK